MSAPTPAELFISTLEAMLEAERDLRLRRNRATARRYIEAAPTRGATGLERSDRGNDSGGPSRQVAG